MSEIVDLPAEQPRDTTLDGGDAGCGELLLEMRLLLRKVPTGGVLEVITTDAGAPEDLPAWCRMTGNRLLGKRVLNGRRTAYFIKKEEA